MTDLAGWKGLRRPTPDPRTLPTLKLRTHRGSSQSQRRCADNLTGASAKPRKQPYGPSVKICHDGALTSVVGLRRKVDVIVAVTLQAAFGGAAPISSMNTSMATRRNSLRRYAPRVISRTST